MAKSKAKVAKAGGASAVAAASPYVQRLVQDEELRGELKSAFDSARVAYGRINNGKAPTQLLDDKKLQKELANAATSLRSASEALRAGPKRRKRRGGGMKRLVFVAIIGGVAALALSEGVRNK